MSSFLNYIVSEDKHCLSYQKFQNKYMYKLSGIIWHRERSPKWILKLISEYKRLHAIFTCSIISYKGNIKCDSASNAHKFPLIKVYSSFKCILSNCTSSPLNPHGQMIRNLVGSIYGRTCIKIAHFIPIC